MRYFLDRLIWRLRWSWAGVVINWKDEHSFRSWVWANLLSSGLAIALPLPAAETALLVMGGLMVLAAECLNTAIERAVDDISTEKRPIAQQAKDAGSAGVALAAIAVGAAWVVILLG